MDETLVPSTIEEYVKLTTKVVKVPSGATLKLKVMGVDAVVYVLSILPEDGMDNDKELLRWVSKHLVGLGKNVVEPNIVEPKLNVESMHFMDTARVIEELMIMGGLAESIIDEGEGKGDGFPNAPSRPNA